MDTVEERVARGMTRLDEKRKGWEDEIDLTTLNVMSGDVCPLGQLYGGYYAGIAALFIGDEVGADFGFQVHARRTVEDAMPEYNELTAEWKLQITARRWRKGIESFIESVDTHELETAITRLSVMEGQYVG